MYLKDVDMGFGGGRRSGPGDDTRRRNDWPDQLLEGSALPCVCLDGGRLIVLWRRRTCFNSRLWLSIRLQIRPCRDEGRRYAQRRKERVSVSWDCRVGWR